MKNPMNPRAAPNPVKPASIAPAAIMLAAELSRLLAEEQKAAVDPKRMIRIHAAAGQLTDLFVNQDLHGPTTIAQLAASVKFPGGAGSLAGAMRFAGAFDESDVGRAVDLGLTYSHLAKMTHVRPRAVRRQLVERAAAEKWSSDDVRLHVKAGALRGDGHVAGRSPGAGRRLKVPAGADEAFLRLSEHVKVASVSIRRTLPDGPLDPAKISHTILRHCDDALAELIDLATDARTTLAGPPVTAEKAQADETERTKDDQLQALPEPGHDRVL